MERLVPCATVGGTPLMQAWSVGSLGTPTQVRIAHFSTLDSSTDLSFILQVPRLMSFLAQEQAPFTSAMCSALEWRQVFQAAAAGTSS